MKWRRSRCLHIVPREYYVYLTNAAFGRGRYMQCFQKLGLLKIFYRALLCIARTMLSQDVRLCVTRYSFETTKHVIKLFFTVRQPLHSSFSTPVTKHGNIPLTEASNAGVMKNGVENLHFLPFYPPQSCCKPRKGCSPGT